MRTLWRGAQYGIAPAEGAAIILMGKLGDSVALARRVRPLWCRSETEDGALVRGDLRDRLEASGYAPEM